LKPGGAAVQAEYRDAQVVHRFRVVRVWEEDGAALAATVGLLPFAVLADWGERDALAEVGALLERVGERALRADLTLCTAVMARLQFEREQVARYLLEAVMWESPLYQELVAESEARGEARGRAEGIAQGRAEGEAQGRAEGKAETLLQMVVLRFGAVPEAVRALVEAAREQRDLALLDALLEAAVRAPTVEALLDALPSLRERHTLAQG
ncbi:MAG: hypothetical protein NZ693_06890, partial [Thermoflexales bacterium]|nr:hypothetical protein [Thermoflexales bacterium]